MKYVRKSTGGLNGSTKLPGLPDIKAGSGNLLKNNKGLQTGLFNCCQYYKRSTWQGCTIAAMDCCRSASEHSNEASE